jgi:hypothetical protein
MSPLILLALELLKAAEEASKAGSEEAAEIERVALIKAARQTEIEIAKREFGK